MQDQHTDQATDRIAQLAEHLLALPDSEFGHALDKLPLDDYTAVHKAMPEITRRVFACIDCGIDTLEAGESYMVRDDVWPLAYHGGRLCVGCLERRIGRRLTPADFTGVPLNEAGPWDSPRLLSRLSGAAGGDA